MSRGKEKEEKILWAIGDLPEDMIADAADYQLPERKTKCYGKWIQAGKGFVCAACAVLVIFELIPWFYGNYSGGGERKTEKVMVEEQKSGAVSDNTGTEERKEGKLYLWSEMGKEIVNTEKDQAVDEKKTGKLESQQKKEDDAREMKEGKTIRLYVKDVPVWNKSGETKKVLPLRIGKSGDGIKYTICSEVLDCRVSSVTSKGVTKQVDLGNVECVGGDGIELNTFEDCEPQWAEDIVPEWVEKEIQSIDIINITGEKGGEIYDFGRIVIGKKGGNYYGIFQKRND